MKNQIDSDIFRKTITKWGDEAQYDQMIEECAELIAVLKHYKRGKVAEAEVIDELADVVLMAHQLMFMFGEESVSRAIDKKLDKLRGLLRTA